MSTRKVVYDDQDSKTIQYTGEWFNQTHGLDDLGNFGPPYLHTLHGTNHDASISFEFDGTGIGIFGTSNLSEPLVNPDPNLECFIDGISIGRETIFQFPENYFRLCRKDGLSAGPHKLRIDITVQSPEQTFWLDQIHYIPSPSVPLDDKVIRLENGDPAIRFDGNWGSLAVGRPGTRKTNAVAHVDFIGTLVSWVGIIPNDFPHGSASGTYSIDDGKQVDFNLAGLPGNQNTTLFNQFFFTTGEVENGPHTLTVTFLGSEGTTPLTLDCLYIRNGTLLTPASNTSSSSAIPSPTHFPSASGGGHLRLNVGALLGGVLGGVGLLIIIAGIFIYCRRRCLSSEEVIQAFRDEPGSSTPFNHYNPQTAFAPNSISTTPLNSMTQAAYVQVPRRSSPIVPLSTKQREAFGAASQHANNHQDGAGSPSQDSVPSGTSRSSRRVHTDSGIRLNQPFDADIPPHYTPS